MHLWILSNPILALLAHCTAHERYVEEAFAPLADTLSTVCKEATVLLAGRMRYRKRFKQFKRTLKGKFTIKQLMFEGLGGHYIFEMRAIPPAQQQQPAVQEMAGHAVDEL